MGSLNRPALPGQRPRIMFVEDEPAIRRLFIASYDEFELMVVENVEQAMEVLNREGEEIAVLMADHYLPDGTGVEVLSWARDNLPDTVRLLTTSRADLNQAMKAVNDGGVSGYITKPWSLEELRLTLSHSVETWLQRRRDRELLAGKRATLMSLASSIAHEMRTPLATIRLRAHAMARHWPMLMDLYREAAACGRVPEPRTGRLASLAESPEIIEREVDRTNLVIEMLLASANVGRADTSGFAVHDMEACIRQALDGYPFDRDMSGKVAFEPDNDFPFFGSDVLVVFILYNLLKNAFHAIKSVGKGAIEVRMERGTDHNLLVFTDTGSGIAEEELPRIFDDFYTTKTVGTGVGLSFCRYAMRNMGGDIECDSRKGAYTSLRLKFPVLKAPR